LAISVVVKLNIFQLRPFSMSG